MEFVSIAIPAGIAGKPPLSGLERIAYALLALGASIFLIGATGAFSTMPLAYGLGSFGMAVVGGLMAIWAGRRRDGLGSAALHAGVMRSAMQRRGLPAWLAGVAFTVFYVLLYWYPETLVHVVGSVDPLSMSLRGVPADRWFLYGTLYTLAVLVMGGRMLVRYRHDRYQRIRTLSVMAFQALFAFLLPAILVACEQPEYYFHYFWPLKPEYLFPSSLERLTGAGHGLQVFMGFWGVVMTVVATPVLTYRYGKRWYCSWVCGCGALAETLGDPWRQNSDKRLVAWQVERWMVHGVLLAITVVTALVWIDHVWPATVFGGWSGPATRWYGFVVGALFSGVIGVGFYPLLGSRIWCRFGCPMAAYLGLLQRFVSRFRITTNGGQCISCGACSTYCEMGIDVRSYAQRGDDVRRASCVGCGICASVCPRGVLRLENR